MPESKAPDLLIGRGSVGIVTKEDELKSLDAA